MSADAMLRSLSDDSWRWIEQGRIEGAERDRTSSIHSAERRGRRKQALSSARNMLADGLPLEKVVRYTGLSVEDLRALETSKA